MWLKKVFLIFATLFYRFLLVGGCYEGERAALMRFKSFMTDPSSRLSSWKGDNCCNWKGIKCSSSGHVVLLNLRNPHPDEVMINVNKEVVSSSKNTSDFALKDMRSNILTSTIPDMLSNLTTLSALDFSANDLDSHIPYLPQLKELYVSGNPAMTVNLVSMFSASWSKLKFLDISFTHVGGTLPPSLTNLTSLTFFQSDGCLRSIPSSVTKLTKLRRLMLNDNNITGQLPVSMSSLISLQYLSLIQNGLRGYIPTSICQILSLEYLNVEWNELTGSVPSCILQLPKFSYLSVQTNNLNGNIPLSLIQKSKLDMISLGINGLSVENDVQ
ncbi:LRR receptor-like serine/threonine-protein kinase SIK1 [Capsicum annuum]|uniref:LRR receptor-like serine/threonine-protein kinase SIK1 n=1 Tax=Capsicum annuum TaxID=4072 RepID=UPI001FB06BCB|nr:LRR receptor-like serine/threonine-protein kinase SIK1 [Capsicum annuum]